MTRLRGWCESHCRLVAKVPCKHWETVTLVHTVNLYGCSAAMVCQGAINNSGFETYCSDFLSPVLQANDTVVLDNLQSHKTAAAILSIESVGAKVAFLPPYSPDLNPIETVFSKFKWIIRSMKERTLDALWDDCGAVSELFPEHECRRHFRHCGYRYT